MSRLLDEIKYELAYLRSHTLQPKWYKALKVFILLGLLLGHYLLFGWKATVLFFTLFIVFSTSVHLVYRAKTKRYKQSWLDFVVTEEGTKPIGRYYYSAIVINAVLALLISRLLA